MTAAGPKGRGGPAPVRRRGGGTSLLILASLGGVLVASAALWYLATSHRGLFNLAFGLLCAASIAWLVLRGRKGRKGR